MLAVKALDHYSHSSSPSIIADNENNCIGDGGEDSVVLQDTCVACAPG
jgi:hypothetical protein